MISRILTAAAFVAALLAPLAAATTAHAQGEPAAPVQLMIPPPPPDTVYLRNGGMVRGRIQDILPGSHVTITLDTGEVRVLHWVDVERAIVASAATIPPLPAPASAPSAPLAPPMPIAPEPAPMHGPTARVHLVTPGSTLFRTPMSSTDVLKTCTAPCDLDLPLEDEYRLSVSGSTSKAFRLHATPGQIIDIGIDPPSTGGIILGGTLATVGGLTVYTCAYIGLIDSLTGASATGDLVAIGAGVGAMALGIVVVVNSLSTDITQKPATQAGPSNRAFLRAPTWRSTTERPLDAGPSGTVTFPIFSKSF